MKAAEIYRSLSTEPHWATKSRAVRWIAARYYAGVISHQELLEHTKPSDCHGYLTIAPSITEDEAREIAALR